MLWNVTFLFGRKRDFSATSRAEINQSFLHTLQQFGVEEFAPSCALAAAKTRESSQCKQSYFCCQQSHTNLKSRFSFKTSKWVAQKFQI